MVWINRAERIVRSFSRFSADLRVLTPPREKNNKKKKGRKGGGGGLTDDGWSHPGFGSLAREAAARITTTAREAAARITTAREAERVLLLLEIGKYI